IYHLKGVADGPSISALVVGLIQATGVIPVDVFIHRETRYPVRLILTQPQPGAPADAEPIIWTIDVFDVDAAAELTPPEAS
ncbi:MAG: hypothetical protein H7Y11_02800, partial [Armatimonadetes bacterium]|nr:hypothetical protein [Anaerolineae bacterium]